MSDGDVKDTVGSRSPARPEAAAIDRRARCLHDLRRLEERAVRLYDRFTQHGVGVVERTLRRIRADHGTALHLLGRLDRESAATDAPLDAPDVQDAEDDAGNPDLLVLVEMCQCEDRWTGRYAEALAEPSLATGDRTLVLAVLLPRQRAHVPLIERLIPFA